MSTAQPIRSKHEVRELAAYYLKRGQIRNHILIIIGLYTALRIKWEDARLFSMEKRGIGGGHHGDI